MACVCFASCRISQLKPICQDEQRTRLWSTWTELHTSNYMLRMWGRARAQRYYSKCSVALYLTFCFGVSSALSFFLHSVSLFSAFFFFCGGSSLPSHFFGILLQSLNIPSLPIHLFLAKTCHLFCVSTQLHLM